MTTKYGIIGYPLGHSLSPTLHNWAFGQLEVDAAYEKWECQPDELGALMETFRSTPYGGASVTIPHKQAVRDFLDGQTYRAKSVGAVNTLFWKNDELWGENTDVPGFMEPLTRLGSVPESAIILGAGGAARAAAAGLRELGVGDICVTNRTLSKADVIAHDFALKSVPWNERLDLHPALIVNTTPLGMAGKFVTETPWPGEELSDDMTVYDIVYNPLQTRLLREAAKSGADTIDGLQMFLHQGLHQLMTWLGEIPDVTATQQLLLDALDGNN